MVFRFAACAVLVALNLWAGTMVASAQTVRLILDYAIQGQQSPIVLAEEGGYFSRDGVEVHVDRGYGSGDSIAKVASGAYDMAFADLGALIAFNSQQGSIKLIDVLQVYDSAPMVILSLKKSNINRPGDLSGKTIASPPSASSRVMFPTFAVVNNIDVSKITWLDVTPQLRETMLKQGQADATTALITDVAGLNHLDISEDEISIMRFSDYGMNLYGHGLLTTPQYAAEHPDVVRKVVRGVADALKAAAGQPDLAIAAIKKMDPLVDEKVERRRLDLVLANAIETDQVKKNGLSAVDTDRMQRTIDLITTTLKRPSMKASDLYRPEYLPSSEELMLR